MKRDPRRTHEKYLNRNDVSALLLKLTRPTIASILVFLEQNLGLDEQIDISNWHEEFFYLSVMDRRYAQVRPADSRYQCAGMRLGITVDANRDCMIWPGSPYPTIVNPRLPRGGNCYVRANKWKRLLRAKYPIDFGGFRVYKDVTIGQYLDAHLTRVT